MMFRPDPPSCPCSGCTRSAEEWKCCSKSAFKTSIHPKISLRRMKFGKRRRDVSLVWLFRVAGWTFPHHMPAACPVRPILPRAPRLCRVRFVTGCACRDFPIRQGLDLADLHCGELDTRIAWQVHGEPHDIDEGSCRRRESVAPHQCDVILAETYRQVAPLR